MQLLNAELLPCRASIEGAVGPVRQARRGRRLRLFPVLAGLFSSYRPEEELGGGAGKSPSSDPLARLATVGGLRSRQRKSRARRRPRPFPDRAAPIPPPRCACSLAPQAALSALPPACTLGPAPVPAPRGLSRTPRTQTPQTCGFRVFPARRRSPTSSRA